MSVPIITTAILLACLSIAIIYTDTRYRRIPNKLVLVTLVLGLTVNTIFGGFQGLLASLGGFALAFVVMLLFHAFGAMGAGDVKLFAAVGSVVGLSHVLPALLVVVLTGALLAVCKMIYSGTFKTTMLNVLQFFVSLSSGQKPPRFEATADRRFTIPYGVAICVGSLVSLFVFRS